MRIHSRKFNAVLVGSLLSLLTAPFAFVHVAASTAAAVPAMPQDELVAKGKERFKAYQCFDCHGENGEGTPNGPDLIHSRRTAEEVSRFLEKPSADAVNKGMPDVPKDDPDHAPLVAYVMSIRAK